jgi:hypothetical protein
MEHDIRFRADPIGDIRKRAAYREPGSLLVGTEASSGGQRETALRLREAIGRSMA